MIKELPPFDMGLDGSLRSLAGLPHKEHAVLQLQASSIERKVLATTHVSLLHPKIQQHALGINLVRR